RQEGRRMPDYSVVLTFDDGFRNFLTAALPRLKERAMPATVFLITDKLGEAEGGETADGWREEDDFSYLSWAEARALREKHHVEFGSHTCSHSRLPSLSPEETERELRDSLTELAEHLGVERPSLSYPKGEHSEIIADQARRLGYSCAVTTDRGANDPGQDLFTLGRTLVGDHDDEASFAVRVSGLREWLVRLCAVPYRIARARRSAAPAVLHPARKLESGIDKFLT
ncbi:MAG TPA: polysaccharide deacetylase family protein, partial [Pyrinomonadaceae bacterium]